VSETPYREPTPDGYSAAWADLRRRRRAAALTIASWVGVMGAMPVAGAAAGSVGAGAVLISGLVLMGWLLRPKMRIDCFNCPACGKTFSRLRFAQNDFARRCVHCGIEMGTPKNAP